jgi:hypothetical protein
MHNRRPIGKSKVNIQDQHKVLIAGLIARERNTIDRRVGFVGDLGKTVRLVERPFPLWEASISCILRIFVGTITKVPRH